MKPLRNDNQPVKLIQLHQSLDPIDSAIVIDEISSLNLLTLAHINNRAKEVANNEDDASMAFGGKNTVFSGDFNQIPCIGVSIAEVIRLCILEPFTIPNSKINAMMMDVAKLFMKFKKLEIVAQRRAATDPVHCARISAIVDYSKCRPISDELIAYFKTKLLTPADIKCSDSPWIGKDSVVLTASNVERVQLNHHIGRKFAVKNSEVVIKWSLQSTKESDESLRIEELETLCNKYEELCGVFIRGAPATLTNNIIPPKGLSNGTQCIMNSLVFNQQDELYEKAMQIINGAHPGQTVFIPIAPTHYIVDFLPHSDSKYIFGEDEYLSDIDPIYPVPTDGGYSIDDKYYSIPIENKGSSHSLKYAIIGDIIIKNHGYYEPVIELLFACTFEKAQGKTIKYVTMCLHKNPWKTYTLSHLYVAFTRVTHSDKLRVWPHPKLNAALDVMKNMEHSLEVKLLNQAYDPEGTFQEDLYRLAYNKHMSDHAGYITYYIIYRNIYIYIYV